MKHRNPIYVLAADIGQAKDYTALIIAEGYVTTDAIHPQPHDRMHDVVHIERFRDVPYPEQVDRIGERYTQLKSLAKKAGGKVEVLVDATGVGKPILDALRNASIPATGVIITAGETSSSSGDVKRVPKRELVTSLQIALQAKRLRIAKGLPLADVLTKEFEGFRVKITLAGHAKFGNDVGEWREAEHDDLVLATSLGTWQLEMQECPQIFV